MFMGLLEVQVFCYILYLESTLAPSTTASHIPIPLSQHEPRGAGLTGGTDLGARAREMDGATQPPPPPAAGQVAGSDPTAGGRAVRLPAVARFVCPFPGSNIFPPPRPCVHWGLTRCRPEGRVNLIHRG
jgi:hypothetical protein